MFIVAFFRKNGSPISSLTPLLSAVKLNDNTCALASVSMTAVNGLAGLYFYDASALDDQYEYVFMVDGGASLQDSERYVFGISAYTCDLSEITVDSEISRKINSNNWRIDKTNKQLIFYDDDQTTPIYTFDLYDERGKSVVNPIERRRV